MPYRISSMPPTGIGSNTTVVLLGLHAFCRARLGRCLDASSATSTRPASVPLAAAWPAQDARRADESRCHSAAHQPSRRLACRQAARVGGPPGGFGLLRWQVGGPQDRPQRLRPQGQGERSIPSRPPAPCLLIPPALALGRFTAALHGPPAPGHPHHCLQSARGGSKHDGGRQVRWLTHTPPAPSPRRQAGSRGGARGSQRHAYQRRPLVPAPARRRVQPSAGKAARTVYPGRCCQPCPPSAFPETARTEARSWASSRRRRRRSAP